MSVGLKNRPFIPLHGYMRDFISVMSAVVNASVVKLCNVISIQL